MLDYARSERDGQHLLIISFGHARFASTFVMPGWMAVTIWMPDDPFPITPTRFPSSCTLPSHAAVCNLFLRKFPALDVGPFPMTGDEFRFHFIRGKLLLTYFRNPVPLMM